MVSLRERKQTFYDKFTSPNHTRQHLFSGCCQWSFFSIQCVKYDTFIYLLRLLNYLYTISLKCCLRKTYLPLCYLIIVIFIILIFQASVGKKGKPLQSDGREIVFNVHKFFSEEFETPKKWTTNNISVRHYGKNGNGNRCVRNTIYRVIKEKKKESSSLHQK